MSSDTTMRAEVWARDNQRYLTLAAAAVAAYLDGRTLEAADARDAADALAADIVVRTGLPVALVHLAELFNLTHFEADILVAAAAPELGLTTSTQTFTFGRALATLPDPHWSALLPDAPLRRWRLLDVPQQIPAAELGGLSQVPLAVDERILHALVGADTLDERLAGRARQATRVCRLAPTQLLQARELAALLAPAPHVGAALLTGEDRLTRRQVAIEAAGLLGLTTLLVDGADIPDEPTVAEMFARLLTRESGLSGRLIYIEAVAQTADRAGRLLHSPVASGVPIVLGSDEAPRSTEIPAIHVHAPTAVERNELFTQALQSVGLPSSSSMGERHPLTSAGIAETVARASRLARAGQTVDIAAVARATAVKPLFGLAEVRHPHIMLSELVLSDSARQTLEAMLAHVRQRDLVHTRWGYGQRERGLALTALFTGLSGTGKTTAAEAIAAELGTDLIRTDLSQIVSKYIGETEKNLGRILDAAETRDSVLLFDEADALFSKRTQVRDSRDRYANMEVSYLLQRLESFAGIAILTTNSRESIDSAFMRRMRFVVTFPFPDADQRATLWRNSFPPDVPTEDLDFTRLAQLSVSGGTIAQLALHSAFLAADAGEPVRMSHVLAAAHMESEKLERPLSPQEVRGWST